MAAIIGSEYCNANTTDIGVLRSVLPIGEEKRQLLVADINNNIIFRVKDTSTFFHKHQKTLLDSNGTPIVTFRPKSMTFHQRWRAIFRGESTDKKDLIFSAKQSTAKVSKDKDLHIYLANNRDETTCDYVVDSSFVFYKRFDNVVIAETKEHMVKVSENVDMAFIVCLIVILDGMREEEAENEKRMASAQQGSRERQANMAMAMY